MIDPSLAAVLDQYWTCEFATLGRDGTPLAWPTAAMRQDDGTLLVTTSLAFAQKALNVRRDGRVALLFSDPTGSGRDDLPQVLVRGTAVCPEEIVTDPAGAEEYWTTLFRRQPDSRRYVVPPARWFMDWYYLRLHITVTPTEIVTRPPLTQLPTGAPASGPSAAHDAGGPVGAGLLARFPSAVLAARDADGAPLLLRTRTAAEGEGFAVDLPADCRAVPGPAGLLVHRHDGRLASLHNALVRGELRSDGGGWRLVPDRVVEPAGSGRPIDMVHTLRNARQATTRYLDRRGLQRPRVRWDRFKALSDAASVQRTEPGGVPSGNVPCRTSED